MWDIMDIRYWIRVSGTNTWIKMEYLCNLIVCFRLDEGISFYVDVKHTINSRDSFIFFFMAIEHSIN